MKQSLVFLLLATSAVPTAAAAEQSPDAPATVITIRPAREPVPALKYRLVPERRMLIRGNAALFYHRAAEMAPRPESHRAQQSNSKTVPIFTDEQIADWVSGPIGQIPREDARNQIAHFGNAFHELDLGARRTTCDWGYDLREEGFELLLPEIQGMRPLARMVTLRTRLAILEGRTDEAARWLENGFALGRHVAHGPTLIQALVGVAVSAVSAQSLQELIQSPGAPSFYWALANRPRPFIDMAAPLEGERSIMESHLRLRELDKNIMSVEQARTLLHDLSRKISGTDGIESPISRLQKSGSIPRGLKDLAAQMRMAAMVAQIYPKARHTLIDQGRPAAVVDAMPTAQVALIYTAAEFDRLVDDACKWSGVPLYKSYEKIEQALKPRITEATRGNLILGMLAEAIPAYNGALMASVRLERQLDALQVIEAIRLYAAAHGGTLPPSLEAIAEAPVPTDPATGKPFDYKAAESTATLRAPVPPGAPNHSAFMIHYELKLAR